jgi:hypothetical protein
VVFKEEVDWMKTIGYQGELGRCSDDLTYVEELPEFWRIIFANCQKD